LAKSEIYIIGIGLDHKVQIRKILPPSSSCPIDPISKVNAITSSSSEGTVGVTSKSSSVVTPLYNALTPYLPSDECHVSRPSSLYEEIKSFTFRRLTGGWRFGQ
jgi:hypothetical protein